MTTEFSDPKFRKVVLLTFWYQFGTKFLIDNDKNLENAAVDRIILKCYHTTIFGDLNYITYTDKERRF